MYPCPACGFLVFDKPVGSYEICPVCNWGDDPIQLKHPKLREAANKESLIEYQESVTQKIPLNIKHFNEYVRDSEWRPLLRDELTTTLDDPRTGQDYFKEAVQIDEVEYYWKVKKIS